MGAGPDADPGDARRWSVAAWAVTAAFGTYFCMYAFRKPFTAAGYADATAWGLAYKPLLVTAQVLGYTVSKFLGIKVVAEVRPHRRAALLLGLVVAAEAALALFAVTPAPWNLLWLFANGVPLGMVFGLVLGFLEGRRQTEALAAGLCASFVVADGAVKSAGAWLLAAGVSEWWMPAATGLLFLPPLAGFTWMLARVPQPTPRDVAARAERAPMTRADRRAFFRKYAPGLTLIVLVFLLVTVLRSVRADFAPEIWRGLLGTAAPPEVFAASETAVGAAVLVLTGSMVLVRDNRRAFFLGLGLAAAGAVLVAVSLLALRADAVSPFGFMVLHGIGLYLPYIAVHTTIFERLIAMTRDRGTMGYLMYLADSFGYLGYVAVLLARTAGAGADDFLGFFVALSWGIAVACLALLVPCWRYFADHPATRRAEPAAIPAEVA
jgi:hypothetical protein